MAEHLHLLLAPKERFEPEGAGAFALNVLETSRVSRFREEITVFGSPVAKPFNGVRFRPLPKAHWWEGDRNRAMARRYAQFANGERPGLIEAYNRPVMIDVIHRHVGNVPTALHFGNDPRDMDGSRSVTERETLLTQCRAIVCVSEFIRRCFLDGLDHPLSARVHVIHTGVPQTPEFPEKEKLIVYVGRVVAEKGVLELAQALTRILPRYPDWSAEIIGARWFGIASKPTPYENSVARAATACDRIALSGFKPHEGVLASLGRAAIAVVPSIWDDPFPRTALEALAQGCALICSTRGGLPELGSGRALYLQDVSTEALSNALDQLIANHDRREKFQHRGWTDFPFELRRATSALDDLRERLMSAR